MKKCEEERTLHSIEHNDEFINNTYHEIWESNDIVNLEQKSKAKLRYQVGAAYQIIITGRDTSSPEII